MDNPQPVARLAGQPIHAVLVPFPIACFVGVFLTDLAYWRTAAVLWETFSVWLLTFGLIVSLFAAIAGLADLLGSRGIRSLGSAWVHGFGNVVALFLSIVNVFVHSRDGYTAVVPTGVILSGIVVAILVFTTWMGRSLVYRHRVGVAN